MSNINQSQSSIVEVILQDKPEGFTFTAQALASLDSRLRAAAVAAWLGSQLKRGRMELISKHGKVYDWRLPRSFWEVPYTPRMTPGAGGNGGHPGKKFQQVPQLKAQGYQRKEKKLKLPKPEITKQDPKDTAYRLFDLAVEVERGDVSGYTIAALLDIVAELIRIRG